MNRHTIRASMLATAMLAASAAFAGADIVKCVDQNGHVILTNSQCGEGDQAVLVAAPGVAASEETAVVPAAPAVRRVTVQRYVLPPAEVRQGTWTSPSRASRPLARDVETLKAARLSMQVLDEASATQRHQRLAGLN
ncbi:MAG: hypothetical protein JWP34_403 [Massilia sp.]|jgi:hypothetical protein|nr:hypothetical protein [Massilia sp.]